MASPKAPAGLSAGGRSLWKSITTVHDLDAQQLVQLEEACRAKDRLDKLDQLLRGDVDTWAEVVEGREGTPVSLRIDSALQRANDTANLMKQLLAALRLPDGATGQRPQRRGARGAYQSGGASESLGKLQALKGGKGA